LTDENDYKMKTKTISLLLSVFCSFLLLSSAAAHHGWAGYKERLKMSMTVTDA